MPLAVLFDFPFGKSSEYIFARNPTNSTGGTPLHSSLNFPIILQLAAE